MSLIQLLFSFFLLCLSFGAIGSFFIFVIDVIKWHKKEIRVKVVPSAQKLPDKLLDESEVKSDEQSQRSPDGNRGDNSDSSSADPTGSGESDTSALFDSWLQS